MEELPYEIHTDASKVGISAILSQKDELGETSIISTASRILTEFHMDLKILCLLS
jgi:hypothetical protein